MSQDKQDILRSIFSVGAIGSPLFAKDVNLMLSCIGEESDFKGGEPVWTAAHHVILAISKMQDRINQLELEVSSLKKEVPR